jgi:hypothetical protein
LDFARLKMLVTQLALVDRRNVYAAKQTGNASHSRAAE